MLLTGFANLLHKELGLFWSRGRWWKHALLWALLMNGAVGAVYYVVQVAPEAPVDLVEQMTKGFYTVGGLAATLGAIFLAQESLIGERQSGTAAWVLSKPASRSAFVLTKFLAQVGSLSVFTAVLSSAILYALVAALTGTLLDLSRLTLAAGLLTLNLAFYAALTLLMATLFPTRPPVLGLAIGYLLASPLLPPVAPWLTKLLPFALLDISAAIARGAPIAQVLPAHTLATSLIWPALLLTLSLQKFRREEL